MCSLEVIEHVSNVPAFLHSLTPLVKVSVSLMLVLVVAGSDEMLVCVVSRVVYCFSHLSIELFFRLHLLLELRNM